MSFVDLMANDVWTEAAIKSRLHAEIRAEISAEREQELNRALQGAALGVHTFTTSEQQEIARFKAVTDRVTALGAEARADAALLVQVIALEAAKRRLAQPETDGDTADRAAAQAVIDAATPAALALLALRNPEPEPEPAPEA